MFDCYATVACIYQKKFGSIKCVLYSKFQYKLFLVETKFMEIIKVWTLPIFKFVTCSPCDSNSC